MSRTATLRYRQGIKWLVGAGLVTVAGIGGYFAYLFWFVEAAQSVSAPLLTIEPSDVSKTVSAGGTVQLGNQQSLKTPTSANQSAIVDRIEVSLNSPVEEGQILVRLRDPQGQSDIEQQEIVVQQQQLTLEKRQRDFTQAELNLNQARNKLEIAQANDTELQKTQANLERAREKLQEQKVELVNLREELAATRNLVEQGYLAENELRNSEKAVRNAEARLRDQANTIQDLELSLENQRLTRQQSLNELRDEVARQQLAVEDAQDAIAAAEQDLNEALLNLTKTQAEFEKNSLIRATSDGRVLDINVSLGDVLQQGDTLLTIGNPQREEVVLNLPTLQATLVEVDQPAKINTIGFIAGTYDGRVREISQVALDEESSSRSQQGTVKAVVVLNEPTGTIIPGSQVSVQIIVEQVTDVLNVPPQFIQERDSDDPFVWVVNEDKQLEKRPVELGLVGDSSTEIKSGLDNGETIASPPVDQTLEPGMTVTPLEESEQ
ncbi:efflux RND transporter periplasmic adaptor subunit [Spirulina sp. CS-785/01]|uniref:efflux RND transporter periplasmic adaptor subunit n=1 Tax=Spirulina sp. CS-785/01 TaxID=3021716 RepID=UPI00232DD871|nr:efflux RND transporter periplasmic adaptor subunit [Spirulina sp. CS-785/01]MDB9314995.1 efflux RND transporter periplasmic adaptor subunit [Spirulina sp. CS-785/01]